MGGKALSATLIDINLVLIKDYRALTQKKKYCRKTLTANFKTYLCFEDVYGVLTQYFFISRNKQFL